MSYMLGLDEQEEGKLYEEINQRRVDREAGLCDYCHRDGSTQGAGFPNGIAWPCCTGKPRTAGQPASSNLEHT